MKFRKALAILCSLAISVTSLISAQITSFADLSAEYISQKEMTQAFINNGLNTVTSLQNFDYDLVYGNAEGELNLFGRYLYSDTDLVCVTENGTIDDDCQAFIQPWRIRGGKTYNSGFRFTAKRNIKFTISFTAKATWGSGYFRTIKKDNATISEVDRSDFLPTEENPYEETKTVEAYLKTGDVLIFYLGSNWSEQLTVEELIVSFAADPSAYVGDLNTENVSGVSMLQSIVDNNFDTVTILDNMDYEAVMGDAYGEMYHFTNASNNDEDVFLGNNTSAVLSTCFIRPWQIRGGGLNGDVGFRFTAKKNIKLTINFTASSDWASGYFSTIKRTNGVITKIDSVDIQNSDNFTRSVDVNMATGESVIFYFGADLISSQTLYFNNYSFTANPITYSDTALGLAEETVYRDIIDAVANNNFGKITTAESFDYELLMGKADENNLYPFTNYSNDYNIPMLKDGDTDNPGRFISSTQLRGGNYHSNVGFRFTAKQNVRFNINFNVKSDWASGFLRAVKIKDGIINEISRIDIEAGTVENPNKISDKIYVDLKKGEELFFYFGHDTENWQTVYFDATFRADCEAYNVSDPEAQFIYLNGISYYPFNSENLLADSVGNNGFSTDSVITAEQEGYLGTGAYFAGTSNNDGCIITDSSLTDSFTEYTISLAAKADRIPDGNMVLFCGGDNYIGDIKLLLSGDGTNCRLVVCAYNGTDLYLEKQLSVNVMLWHHYAITVSDNGNHIYIYLDGELFEEYALNTALIADNTSGKFMLGKSDEQDDGLFKGSMDEVNIFDQSLTANQVFQLCNYGTVKNYIGDLNQDGVINIIDLVRLKKNIAMLVTSSVVLSDINNDGKVDSLDLSKWITLLLNDKLNIPTEDLQSLFSVAPAFNDNMVLQRNENVKVFGYGGKAGQIVTVAYKNQIKEATVTPDGWSVHLDPMPANANGDQMVITYGDEQQIFKNVVVGEVWLCSGQSNMQKTLGSCYDKDNSILDDYAQYVNISNIRACTVPFSFLSSQTVNKTKKLVWNEMESINDAFNFSATALAYALNLQAMLGEDVPVGVVVSAVGGSDIRSWIDETGMSKYDYDSSDRSVYYNGMTLNVVGYTFGGVLWYQGEANAYPGGEVLYAELFNTMVTRYRTLFNSPNLPFVTVQLVQFAMADGWQWHNFRQMQWELMNKIDNVYTVCAIDCGDNTTPYTLANENDCIHPADKWPIGQRAAGIVVKEVLGLSYDSLAVNTAYGISPSIVAAVNTDNGVVLTVSNANALTAGEGTIQYFEVYNGSEWQAATAQISGNVISLSADCASIQKVRYLYRDVFDSSNAFIYNEYGLPLAPIASIDVE